MRRHLASSKVQGTSLSRLVFEGTWNKERMRKELRTGVRERAGGLASFHPREMGHLHVVSGRRGQMQN